MVATNNRGKLREYAELLKGIPFELTTLSERGITEEVEETGSSLKQNSIHKATTYAKLSGLTTMADDSGLEVDALGGEPGPLSRRYAGIKRETTIFWRSSAISPGTKGQRASGVSSPLPLLMAR